MSRLHTHVNLDFTQSENRVIPDTLRVGSELRRIEFIYSILYTWDIYLGSHFKKYPTKNNEAMLS